MKDASQKMVDEWIVTHGHLRGHDAIDLRRLVSQVVAEEVADVRQEYILKAYKDTFRKLGTEGVTHGPISATSSEAGDPGPEKAKPEGCDCWGSGTCSACDPDGSIEAARRAASDTPSKAGGHNER